MAISITPQEIEDMKRYLREHPAQDAEPEEIVLDGAYDHEQEAARLCREILSSLGELPE